MKCARSFTGTQSVDALLWSLLRGEVAAPKRMKDIQQLSLIAALHLHYVFAVWLLRQMMARSHLGGTSKEKGGWIKASWSVPIAAGVGDGSYYGRPTEVSALELGTRRFLTWKSKITKKKGVNFWLVRLRTQKIAQNPANFIVSLVLRSSDN